MYKLIVYTNTQKQVDLAMYKLIVYTNTQKQVD